MAIDFTLNAYANIIRSGLSANYPMMPVLDWFSRQNAESACVMLRHDVDRHPENAVAMARVEADLGVRASYYFRIVPESFVIPAIEEIRDLGHEIGYHYEDWYLANGDPARARELFEMHLERLRQIAPIRSIAMHGSPLARQNNMSIWKHLDYNNYDVIDAILSFDYSGYVFFTDSGRTFGQTGANLRDYLGDADVEPSVRSSEELAAWLSRRPRERVQINVHPERWNEKMVPWVRQLMWDITANSAKRVIKLIPR